MSELTTQQENLITLVLISRSITEACKKAQISRATYYIWLKNINFRQRLREEIDKVFFEARQNIKKASLRASEVLENLLNCKEVNQRRLSALAVLELAHKDKSEEIEDRLQVVEKIIAERKAK